MELVVELDLRAWGTLMDRGRAKSVSSSDGPERVGAVIKNGEVKVV